MKNSKIEIIAFLLMVLAIASCKEDESNQPIIIRNDPPAADISATTRGLFVGYAHGLSGNAILYKENDNTHTLRFENFYVTPGPDVHVLLSKSSNYSNANVIDITTLDSGYSNSNINFPLQVSYSDEYKFVLVYCIEFNSLFGYAQLE